MTSLPLISVIVPVYKVEPYLDRCVQSIVSQTYDRLEILLIDDGSPDRCPEMCDEWAKRDPRIRVIHKVNGGVSSARNEGLRAATGAWLSFVDSDDWLHPQFFEITLMLAEKYASSVVAVDKYRTEIEETSFPVSLNAVSVKNLRQRILYKAGIIGFMYGGSSLKKLF